MSLNNPTKNFLNLLFFLTFAVINAQQLAFPSAKGAGAYTTGGRGGEIVHVTNLNDSGTGSLRWALTDASNRGNSRTIVFDVSGIINLSSDILIDDTGGQGYADGITIAGQTAPEGNITITGGKLKFYRIDHIIVRYLKFRSTTDVNGSLLVGDSHNTIFDHLTASHTEGGEVAFGIIDNGVNLTSETTDRTFQNNLVHDCGLGLILGDTTPSGNDYAPAYSVIQNAFINISHRAPGKVGGALRLDVVNNLVHNHNDRLLRIDDWDYTLNNVGNYYSRGGQSIGLANTAYFGNNNGLIYDNDNYYDPDFNVGNWIDFDQPREDPVPASSFVQNPFTYNNAETFNILPNSQLKTEVLPFAGCYKYINDNGQVVEDRDVLDTTAINQAITESTSEYSDYEITLGEIPTANNTRPGNFYQSNPHIPEAYLVSRGITGNATIHNQVQPSGYTLLEEYINQVDASIPDVTATGVDITPETASLNVPETLNLTKVFTPSNTTNQTGTWSSSDPGIATVNQSGLVTSVSEGVATITFTSNDGGFTATSEITVTNIVIDLTNIEVTPNTMTLDVNQTEQLSVEFFPGNATDTTGVWSTSDSSIVSVDAEGNITSVAEGNAEITFTSNDGNFTDTSIISVVDVMFGSYEFYNAETDEMIQEITGDTSFDLSITGDQINFRIIPDGGDANPDVESIEVLWTGQANGNWVENNPIYAGLPNGNTDMDFSPYTVEEGVYNFTITYYSGDDASGNIVATDSFSITFFDDAVLTANAGTDQSICEGESTTLTASGGSNYLWNTGETTASIDVSPTSTTTYTVTVSNSSGEEDSDSVTVSVMDVPIITASQNVTITEGDSTVLTVEGANTYLWSTGETSSAISVNPTETTTYAVVGSNGNCDSEEAQITVTVNSVFQAEAGEDQRVCENDDYSVTLTANQGDSYLWSTGETTQSITVSPLSTTQYTVTVTLDNASDEDSVTVFVDPNPNVSIINGENVDILAGDFITLSATGANTYEWNNGATQPNIAVSPSQTTSYEVRGYINDCYDEKQVTVNVYQEVQASAGEDVAICLDDSVILTASGGDEYLWSTGETTQSIEVSPIITTDYYVTVFNPMHFDEASVRVEVDTQCDLEPTEPGDETLNFGMDIYPNPADRYVDIDVHGTFDTSEIEVYDITGKLVIKRKIQNDNTYSSVTKRLNISQLQEGIYVLRLIDEDRNVTKKLIVN